MSSIRKTSQCSVYKYPPTNSLHLMFHALKPIVKFKFRGLLGSVENAGIRVELSSEQEAGKERPCIYSYFRTQWSWHIHFSFHSSSHQQIMFRMRLIIAHASGLICEQFQTQSIFNLCFITSHHKSKWDEAMTELSTARAPGRDLASDNIIQGLDWPQSTINTADISQTPGTQGLDINNVTRP